MDYENDPGWKYLRRSREQLIEDQSKPYDSKKNVWIPDAEEGYVAAEIKTAKGDKVTVVVQGGVEKTVRKDEIQEMNPPKFEKAEDMSNLTFLNDASVLYNLRARYACMLIYTYSGLFCVVINPYKRLPIYTDSVARMFMGKRRTEMPPHLFAVSDEAYRSMLQNRENQSMLITGESGAGKTENTKKVIAYFASLGASQQEKERSASGKPAEVAAGEKRVTLEDQIVQTNPVLEAFGNAKTVRNNNSSRFGKFIRIHFTKTGKVASCDIEHYLLEKSRVVRQAPGERCYHIFYQLFSGYKPKLLSELLLDKPVKEYYSIAQAELTIDGIDDKEEHQLTDEAFHVLNFSETEISDCYKLVAAMLHMGNMKFKQRPREEQAETDGTDEAEKASKMYGVATDDFLKALLRPRVKVGTEWVNKGQNMEQVAWSVGAMAKGLYSRLFNWLVQKCNNTLTQTGTNKDFFIGVLDIAGFEIFDFNSFEQLWINFVNEKLQQFFNHHMFVLEQEEYAREGIEWTFIDFGLDLQACIELIEKPMGIVSMLDEECIVPKASDQTLAQKLIEQHLGKHPNFEKPKPPKGKQAEAHFAMRHYAGTVRYNVTNWLEKNKDPLNDTLVQVMKQSQSNKLLVEVWGDYTTQEEALAKSKSGEKTKKKGKSGSFMTVSMMYRESLNNLMTMLNTTHPHFIRCIIPNEKKQSGLIDASLVLNQLTCNGVLEGIRICRKGFPNRTMHHEFVKRYVLLAPEEAKQCGKDGSNAKQAAEKILKQLIQQGKLKEDQFRVGQTKVFFKAGVVAHVEDLRDQRLNYLITALQAQIRWYCAQSQKARFRKQFGYIRVIQNNIRNWIQLQTWSWFRLYGKVKPFLVVGKEQEEMDALTTKVTEFKEGLVREKELKETLAKETKKMEQERMELERQLEQSQSKNAENEQKLSALTAAKEHLEESANDATFRLAQAEQRVTELSKGKKRVEAECASLKKNIAELDLSLRKVEAEKQSKENQIRALVDESQKQEATLAKLNREKKQQQEAARKLMEELKAEEERSGQEKLFRQKLQNALESAESEVEREKRISAETDKSKRKLDGELRIARENLDELSKQRQDLDAALKRKEAELFSLAMRVESAQNSQAKVARQLRDNDARLKALEAELETERQARTRSERAKNELQYEIDEMSEQLNQHGAATAAQMEMNKKKDAEIAKIRREIEQLKLAFDHQMTAVKKKGVDATAELSDQADHLQRQKAKAEKERMALQKQLQQAHLTLDDETRKRADAERRAKTLEAQLSELRAKSDEEARQIQELSSLKSRLQSESSEFTHQIDDLEAEIAAASRLKVQYNQQADELKRAAADEAREKQSLKIYSKNLQHELDQLRESLEEEIASRSDVLRQLSRAQAEALQWKSRFESEGLMADEDADEIRRKQIAEIAQLQNELDSANARLASLEKQRSRLAAEVDASRSEADDLGRDVQQLERLESGQQKAVGEWRHKADETQAELDAAQREARQQVTEAHRLRSAHDQILEQVESLRRENKQLMQEIHDMKDSLNGNARNVHETEAAQRRLEVEKDELQHALDEAEAALEAEESKMLRSQVEVSQIRAEIEKRLQEKEEEFESICKNHQQTIEGFQNSLDVETKNKVELLRVKKKLEADIADFEMALEHANRANEDAQKNLKRYAEQVKELQQQVDENQRSRQEFHEKYLMMDKRYQSTRAEQQELVANLETLQRFAKQLELELNDVQVQNNELQESNQVNASARNKLESELALLKNDLNEAQSKIQVAQDRSKSATADASRIAEELRAEQERSNLAERQRKALEFQIKDLQSKIDEVEHQTHRGGAKTIAKLEGQLKSVESELETEQRHHADAAKNFSKAERRLHELQFQVEEERKNYAKLCELAEKLQAKIKAQRRSLDEAEESANVSLQKYRTFQIALDNAEERADTAESALVRVRSRSRVASRTNVNQIGDGIGRKT